MKDTLQFILAGNALFTVENAETGNRFTFKVRKPDDDKPHFVSVLTGADNENDYSFLGTVFDGNRYRHGRKSRIASTAPSARAFEWLLRKLSLRNDLPAQVRVCHCGKCGRCGKTLTVPASVDSGFCRPRPLLPPMRTIRPHEPPSPARGSSATSWHPAFGLRVEASGSLHPLRDTQDFRK